MGANMLKHVQATSLTYPDVLVSIDPGAISGVAVLVNTGYRSQLIAAAVVRETTPLVYLTQWLRQLVRTGGTVSVIWERPQIYRMVSRPTNPNNLITTSYRAGKIVGAVCANDAYNIASVKDVLPREWKGQVPKKAHNDRTVKQLDAEELNMIHGIIWTADEWDDLIDAVALGKWQAKKKGWPA